MMVINLFKTERTPDLGASQMQRLESSHAWTFYRKIQTLGEPLRKEGF